jgi:periplasmic protein TonB
MDSFGGFNQCMVDADPETRRRERRIRRTGLAVAIGTQTALLAALVLIPILTPAALPRLVSIVEIPMFRPPTVVRAVVDDRTRRPSATSYVPNNVTHPRQSARPSEAISTDDLAGAIFFNHGSEATLGDILGPATPTMPAPPAASREAPRKPLAVDSGVMEAMLVRRIEPIYPKIAEVARISGPVVLSAIIASDGSIQSLTLVSGNPVLAPAAEVAVREWRYKPTMLDGQPVEVETLITVNFVLNSD